MSHCKTMYRLAVAVLATSAMAAPAAIAMPIDPGSGGTATDPRQKDMHASTVQSPAVQQEHRTPDARDRTPAPKPEAIPEGMPTWPVNPQTLPQPKQPAVAPTGGGDGGGVDWTVPAIALAACLMLGGAAAVARTRLRAARSGAH